MWLLWDTKKGCHLFGATKRQKAVFPVPLRSSPDLLLREAHHRRNTAKTKFDEGNFKKSHDYLPLPEQQTLGTELGPLTDVDPSHFSLEKPHILTNAQTHKQPACTTAASSTHNPPTTVTWRGRHWSLYLLHSNLPLSFDSSSFMPLWHYRATTPCLSARPSVCPSSVLPVTAWLECPLTTNCSLSK